MSEIRYCQSCKEFLTFKDQFCPECGKLFEPGPVHRKPDVENYQQRKNVKSSTFLSNFFITTANVVVVLGFFIGLLSGYNATHTSYMGQTYAVPNAFFGFLVEFLIVFSAACLSAAMLAFFGYVLRALNTLTEKQNNS